MLPDLKVLRDWLVASIHEALAVVWLFGAQSSDDSTESALRVLDREWHELL
jgi:hypothetical protein